MSPELPAGWIAYTATVRYSDGPADAADAQLNSRAWGIWSPARFGPDGRFLDPTLTVVSAMAEAA